MTMFYEINAAGVAQIEEQLKELCLDWNANATADEMTPDETGATLEVHPRDVPHLRGYAGTITVDANGIDTIPEGTFEEGA